MSTLKDKAQAVQTEKNTKVLSENIKDGVTLFGVTGSLKASDFPDYVTRVNNIKNFLNCSQFDSKKVVVRRLKNTEQLPMPSEEMIARINDYSPCGNWDISLLGFNDFDMLFDYPQRGYWEYNKKAWTLSTPYRFIMERLSNIANVEFSEQSGARLIYYDNRYEEFSSYSLNALNKFAEEPIPEEQYQYNGAGWYWCFEYDYEPSGLYKALDYEVDFILSTISADTKLKMENINEDIQGYLDKTAEILACVIDLQEEI